MLPFFFTKDLIVLKTFIRFFSWICLLAGLLFALSVVPVLINGGPWTFTPGGRQYCLQMPLHHLAYSVIGLVGWYLLRYGPTHTRRDWMICAGRLLLFGVSLGVSILITEFGIRGYITQFHKANSFDYFKKLRQAGKQFKVRTTHPMSVIIQPTDDQHIVYELQPNLDMEFGHKRLKTNSAGMRASREYPLARIPNSVRIIGLGDSGMFGWDMEQDEDYMAVLEKNLNQQNNGVTYECLNFGTPGYNTQLEYECLRVKGLPFKPDIVVLGWCGNDYSLPFFMLQQSKLQRNVSYFYQLLFNRSALWKTLEPVQFRELRSFNKDEVLPKIKAGTDVAGVRQALKNLKTLCGKEKIHLIVFGPMDQKVVAMCKDENICYFNTYEQIPANTVPKEYAVHFMHPRPAGHAVLAKALEHILNELGWLAPHSE